jgi:hypothetical protein
MRINEIFVDIIISKLQNFFSVVHFHVDGLVENRHCDIRLDFGEILEMSELFEIFKCDCREIFGQEFEYDID